MKTTTAAALLVAALLGGCASSTQTFTNTKASDAVKAKSFSSYKEVLFVPPKEDPRQVVPRVVKEIESLGLKVTTLDPSKPIEAPQGTAFVISPDGWMLTCAHVLKDQKEATITLNGQRLLADVVKSDTKVDLALLKLRDPLPKDTPVLAFRQARPAAMGEDVFTIGYPLSRLLGNNARMTKGLLSATSGLRDDVNELQVSAEIQPGNSGGPLLDQNGQILGIIRQTLNPGAVAQATGGALPQNVNFAVKDEPAIKFLREADADGAKALVFDRVTTLDTAAKAVAKVQAGIVDADGTRSDKVLVKLVYSSHWDIWWRFRVFIIAAYDYETLEPLFATGQGRDNMISNEEVVIHDTMENFRKSLRDKR